ncbi:MAG: hypothetical protein H6742_20400 [Alphaproteobacteria bacterium]|nr:hypothetical protein [Alphaproteobacteria bacterium]
MPALLALPTLLLACPSSPGTGDSAGVDDVLPETCEDGDTLFGRPSEATGLSDAECGPACACEGETWTAPEYDDADIAALRAWQLSAPYAPVLEDPYQAAAPDPLPADTVCGFVADDDQHYHLSTFDSAADADAAGARVTHTGGCGVCSTLEDLAVYMTQLDLTDPVRACGLEHMGGDPDEHVACLEALGFTTPCAWIWYWNTLNTQDQCLSECLAALSSPYNEPDGSLNPCLQCDEDHSGPVFKAVAGRTRRNTGVPNTICRPCGEVTPLVHRYP